MSRPVAVFGDVHGEADILEALIAQIRTRFGEDVDLYCTGDLIDRGPDSRGVIDICIREGVKCITGNHELWLTKLATEQHFDDYALQPAMAGDWTLLSYEVTCHDPIWVSNNFHDYLPEGHKEFLADLPLTRTFMVGDQKYRLIHAGVKEYDAKMVLADAWRIHEEDPDRDVSDLVVERIAAVKPNCLLWTSPNIRRKHEKPNLFKFPDGSIQIFGHLPLPNPMKGKHWIGIDTGCGTCAPFTLTAVVLQEGEDIEFIQASAAG